MPRGTSDRDNLLLQGRLWTPQNINTGTALSGSLLGWYDAMDFSTISASSGSIDSWRDKSAFGRTISNTGAQRPTFSTTVARGWPGLTNTASQGLFHSTPYMYAACDTGGTGITVSIVSFNQSGGNVLIGEASTASNNPIFSPSFVLSGLQHAYQQRNDANTVTATSTAALGGIVFGGVLVSTNTIQPASGTTVTSRTSGVVGATPKTRTYSGASTFNSFSIAGYYRVGNIITTACPGTICEVVIAAGTDLRTAQLIEGYMAWKWPALSVGTPALNEDHPFVNRPPEIGQ